MKIKSLEFREVDGHTEIGGVVVIKNANSDTEEYFNLSALNSTVNTNMSAVISPEGNNEKVKIDINIECLPSESNDLIKLSIIEEQQIYTKKLTDFLGKLHSDVEKLKIDIDSIKQEFLDNIHECQELLKSRGIK